MRSLLKRWRYLCLIRKKTGMHAIHADNIVCSRRGNVDYQEIKEGTG